jgi:hypothetical protein
MGFDTPSAFDVELLCFRILFPILYKICQRTALFLSNIVNCLGRKVCQCKLTNRYLTKSHFSKQEG